MSEDIMRLAAEIAAAWYSDCLDKRTPWRAGGHSYRPADEDEYRALGEDPDAEDAPLILAREDDGAFFEVDLDVTVTPTSAESRKAWKKAWREQAAQWRAAQAVAEAQGKAPQDSP